jgi:hypothetical protein
MPEAPVEALPKAPVTAKPPWATRRLDPGAAPPPRPRVDHAPVAAAGLPSGDSATVQSATPSGAAPDDSGNEKAALEFPPSAPPPIDPLLKAVHDDIEEEEAAHRK